MYNITETLLTAVISFIGTNIDDIFILTLFFAECKALSVISGQYLGIGTLTAVSLLGAYGLGFIPEEYIKWLGLIPIALGIKAIFDRGDGERKTAVGAFGIALVTIANGGDNLGVYIPLFAGYSIPQMIATVLVFALMTALWCLLGEKLSLLPMLKKFLQKYKQIIVPVVFIALGLYILIT